MNPFVLFDLDGTITDSAPGILAAARYALAQFGITEPDDAVMLQYIGPPLPDSFETYHGLSPQDARTALAHYRTYYAAQGIFQCALYPGIRALLRDLSQAGMRVVLATSKPEPFARQILAHFDILQYFSFVCGNTMDETRTSKAQVLAEIAAHYPDLCPENAVMVGDRRFDCEGAQSAGIPAIGVLYGFGSRDELQKAGAYAFAETVEALRHVLCGVLHRKDDFSC
ncbi:MAG: HAD hydrolase-like protein [Oscillospiraceae bacterium]|nr:HAD hydrolase-like protein [Oscillospiraceae bacterium]